ncbi:exodeoxyribonuclease VII small subunit [Aphanothece hegewaldii CCALA 016]|uniref:Exodeoxyribonuclease 7 small subunit n=1 Tax=Aphanothece hegewaldii CCALA 016 TaxID=2107694 RepID=A0A2T1M022_9CHRO|nr:exodeoxyribonuclease VII small subunit [Aphanothece hegewaldii]PSF37970.1 exodeoxyribonuclease VII small subunit [Aphanothece hegewaldii CCALA 016]
MPPRSKKSKDFNYETTITEVEAMIEQIESGSLTLEDVFDKFTQASNALAQCEAFLAQGKQRMDLLIEVLESSAKEDLEF